MDIWRDAAVDVEKVRSEMEPVESSDPESTHWELKVKDWYDVWRNHSEKGESKRERAVRYFESIDEGVRLYRVDKHLVKER